MDAFDQKSRSAPRLGIDISRLIIGIRGCAVICVAGDEKAAGSGDQDIETGESGDADWFSRDLLALKDMSENDVRSLGGAQRRFKLAAKSRTC